ncbi:MAG: RAD55 family ATPase [Melioribacteraceae bacterium]|nr:RAD55 family ATPase [Melioribacteraceae bacterium]MCF8354559.1 RAD55 family ATPase [Melioribacteraceae bacterium]MCF8394491.1 RAD55 family ATPase [Melioribacteraceae bacterium]MCF8420099.1 RAD55 family ATPase [Melioribacteraceae bacterium]
MGTTVRLISSGFKLIDKNWGGVYRGGSYVIIGPRKSGRTLLGLQFALETAKSQEVCLFFTNMRPKDLMIQAASLNFDIQSYMNQNLIIVVRVAPPNDIYEMHNPDDYLVEYLNDIVTVVNQYHPDRIIFDELTPYIGFNHINRLRDSFLHTIERIEDHDITSMFIISEPATQRAQELVETITNTVTGVIYLKKSQSKFDSKFHGGTVVITPNVGHAEGQFSAEYKIEPYKGISIDSGEETKVEEEDSNGSEDSDFQEPGNIRLTRMDVTSESYTFSNVYSYTDFQLILNNQIALYRSTGQKFNLISFKLDPAAQVKGLLSLNQLKSSVKSSTDKKDKICVVDNKVMVLVVRSDRQKITNLMQNLLHSLPSQDRNYLRAVVEFISIFNAEVNESVENADAMIEYLESADESGSGYRPFSAFIK